MESYLKKNGRLMDSGLTKAEIESRPWFTSGEFGISDTGQTLDPLDTRRHNFEIWHYAKGFNLYFKSDRDSHGLMKAFEALFTPERWNEIEHLLDEMDVHRLLERGNLGRLKKKVLRARENNLLTASEVQDMAQVVNGA